MSSALCSFFCWIGQREVIAVLLVKFSDFQAEQKLGHRDMLWRSIKGCVLREVGHALVAFVIQSR